MNLDTQTSQKHEKGQILVILALIAIGLIAIVGLVVDAGYMYLSYSRLRRAVDAAALSATTQYKKNVPIATLELAAREFLVLNGVPDTNSLAAEVDTCKTLPSLCPGILRKLVRVTAREDVPMFFMSVIGIRSVPIEVTSISEAAAIDLVLVLDRSESMGYFKDYTGTEEWPKPSINRDPSSCNTSQPDDRVGYNHPVGEIGNCHPFQEVKEAAYTFVDTFMDPEFDKVAIVVFDNTPHPVSFGTDPITGDDTYLSNDRTEILDAINNLWMYDGVPNGSTQANDTRLPTVYTKAKKCDHYKDQRDPTDPSIAVEPLASFEPCRLFTWDPITNTPTANYEEIDYIGFHPSLSGGQEDFTLTGSTNIGGGLFWAANILSTQGRREGALWVTVLLTDGIPNAGYDESGDPICPDPHNYPRCRDTNANVRHYFEDPGHPIGTDDVIDASLYDTDDYSRDQADSLGVGSLIFAIGLDLGDRVTVDPYAESGTPPAGSTLLSYIAEVGGTDDYFDADPADLQKIFLAIANKIATRLTQ